MIKIIVENKGSGKKLVTYVQSKFNKLPQSALYKALRNKDIRINDVKITENVVLYTGDEITLYIKDEILYGQNYITTLAEKNIIYDDSNIIVINKPKNMLVESEKGEIGLDKLVSEYCKKTVKPCHRLDRNTEGLVIFAKNNESEEIILDLIKNRSVEKYYKCLVYGIPKAKKATLRAYLFKDSKNSNVIISDVKKPGYTEIITKYNVLKCNSDNTSILEVELVTGRTHQIRAHLAYAGFPILGDGKYGINEINRRFGLKTQELKSYKLTFKGAYGILEYLNGKTIEI